MPSCLSEMFSQHVEMMFLGGSVMKKLIVLLMCCVIAGKALAVTAYTDDFDAAPGTDVTASGYWAWSTGGDYSGSGSYSLNSADGLNYPGLGMDVLPGDFTAELQLVNYSASLGPTDFVADFEYTEFIWNTYDDNGYISLQITNWHGDMYFKALEWDNALGWINYVQPIVTDSQTIDTLGIRETWTDDTEAGKTGQWDFEYNLNGEGWVAWHTITSDQYTDEASAARWGQFYAIGHQDFSAPWYEVLSEISVDVDSYSITPEPTSLVLLGIGGFALLRRKRS